MEVLLNRFTFQLSCVLVFSFFSTLIAQQSTEKAEDTVTTIQSPNNPNESSTSTKALEKTAEPSKAQIPYKKFGFGISFAERIFYPQEINDLSKDIYDEMKRGYIVLSEMGSADIFLAYSFRAQFLASPIPNLSIVPYADVLWMPKFLMMNSSSENIHLLCYTGGINVLGIVAPQKRITFKGGAGFSYGSSNLYVSGDYGDVTMSGSVFGINLIAGLNINLNKVTINVDFIVPVQTADFSSRSGSLNSSAPVGSGTVYRYPKSANLIGLEIREGVTFNF
jgi:hypothetical protein